MSGTRPTRRRSPTYPRSGVHALRIAAFAWAAHLCSNARASLWLRRWPIPAEIALCAAAMTSALAVAIVGLQAALYGLVPRFWSRRELPALVAASFAFAALFEPTRLIGARTLLSVILGRYRRPAREDRAPMFLAIAGSTAMAARRTPMSATRRSSVGRPPRRCAPASASLWSSPSATGSPRQPRRT